MQQRHLTIAGLAVAAAVGLWLLFFALPRIYGPERLEEPPTAAAGPEEPARKIRATLFYVSDDGLRLTPVEREVAYGESTAAQARYLIEAQLQEPPAPLIQAVPAGTHLRALYITDRGDAFVDLSGDLAANHTGGSLDELFTIYVLVNTLTTNLPAVGAVQILIDGREVDTLAGHVDLRQPLRQNLTWVRDPRLDQPEPAEPPVS
jgi:hypothetical protein